jgi:two-component system sensor histidine kinase GlrK
MSARIRSLTEATQAALDNTMLSSQKISSRGTRIALYITGFAVLCGVAFGFIIAKSLYIPLQRLKQGTRDIAQGDFSRKIEIRSADEIGDVSASFNQMCDRLRELDQLKADFVSNITHDLKTPLASITEANNLLAEGIGGPLSPEQKRLLAIIREDAARLLRLVESIIDLSRMEAGLLRYEFVPSDIAGVITEAVDAVRLLADSRKIAVSVSHAAGLPAVAIDRAKLMQGLINLLGNAIKFTPEGGSVQVRARTFDREQAADSRFLEIAVADTGVGIPSEDLPRIFDKFYQGREGVQKRGSGLGLAIARHIIEAHGGTISAASAPAGGSTFYILLPLRQAAA